MNDGFVSYAFPKSKVYGLSKELVQARKRVRNMDGALTTVTLEAIPMIFHGDVSRVDLAFIRHGYADYCRQEGADG